MSPPSIIQPAAIGTPFEGGFYGGLIRSHGGAKTFAIAWAPKALGELTGVWHPPAKNVPDAASCAHSVDNTVAMATAGSKLAVQALALDINGFKDWCLPARDVLELAYLHLKPGTRANWASFRDGDNPSAIPAGYPYTKELPTQTSVELFRAGGDEAFEEVIYWTSSQFSAGSAWYQLFYNGLQFTNDKKFSARARACRLIPFNS